MRVVIGMTAYLSMILAVQAAPPGQTAVGAYEKKTYSYAEWAKGHFSEVVTVSNPAKLIYPSGVNAADEDSKVEAVRNPGDFAAQCRYVWGRIKGMLAKQGATLANVDKAVTSVVWMMALFTATVPTAQASDENIRSLPLLYSFYQDDESCSKHAGEATEQVTWNGRTWYLTAPVSLVSPPSETKRNGTPLDIGPLNDFVTQAQQLGATIVHGDLAIAADRSVGLRLVMVVHDLVAEGPGQFSLQTIIAVRLCGSTERFSGSALYIGPRKGVNLTEWWRSRKSQRWIDGYREAFSLSVTDALEWAAAKAIKLSAIERFHSGSIPQAVKLTNRCSGRPSAAAELQR